MRTDDTEALATLDKRLDNGVGISDNALNCRSRRVFVGTYDARHFHFYAAVSVNERAAVFNAFSVFKVRFRNFSVRSVEIIAVAKNGIFDVKQFPFREISVVESIAVAAVRPAEHILNFVGVYKTCRKQHEVLNLVVFVDFQHAVENFVFFAVFADFDTSLFCVFGPCARDDVVLLFKDFLVGNKFRKHAERVKISAEFAQHISERACKAHGFHHRLHRVCKRIDFRIRDL